MSLNKVILYLSLRRDYKKKTLGARQTFPESNGISSGSASVASDILVPITVTRKLVGHTADPWPRAASIDISGMAATIEPRVTLYVYATIYAEPPWHTPWQFDCQSYRISWSRPRCRRRKRQRAPRVDAADAGGRELHGASRAPRRTRQWKWLNQRLVRHSVYSRLTRFTSIIAAILIVRPGENFSLQRYITLIPNVFLPLCLKEVDFSDERKIIAQIFSNLFFLLEMELSFG